jgi:ferritin-like metal-binding protein YciE
MPTLDTLKDLLIDGLQCLCDAEIQLAKVLPKMARATGNAALKAAFLENRQQARSRVERLIRVLKILQAAPEGEPGHAGEDLIEQCWEATRARGPRNIRDANLLNVAQKVERHGIATYRTVCSVAEKIGENDVASLLQESLTEKIDTDRYLGALLNLINDEISFSVKEAKEEALRHRPMNVFRPYPPMDEVTMEWH